MLMTTLAGPMFEPADSGPWHSIHKKTGAHYNTYACHDRDGMAALREFMPEGPDEFNFVLFSTSGVHGTYNTIEGAERGLAGEVDEYGDPHSTAVTFLIVQPRICCVRYGNCTPQTAEDIAFLKDLRARSWAVVQKIGRDAKGVDL